MAVDVQRDRAARMTQHLRDYLRVDALRQEKRRAGVPEVVESYVGQPASPQERLPVLVVEVVAPDRPHITLPHRGPQQRPHQPGERWRGFEVGHSSSTCSTDSSGGHHGHHSWQGGSGPIVGRRRPSSPGPMV